MSPDAASATLPDLPDLRDLPGWLHGDWAIHRVINDGAGRFTGTATFRPDGSGGAVWRETGRLTLGAHDGPAGRTLLIAPPPPPAPPPSPPSAPGPAPAPAPAAGGAWQVRFDDGRPFHRLDLSNGGCQPEHRCGPDRYRGRFVVLGADRMTVGWRITGPGRADVIASEYRRRDA